MANDKVLFEIEKKSKEEAPGETPKRDFIIVKNDWWDAICRTKIPPNHRQILDFIIRMTYGWQKKTREISLKQFSEGTGISRPHVSRAIKCLKERKLITVTSSGNSSVLTYGFNKYFRQWKTQSTVTSLGKEMPSCKKSNNNNGLQDNLASSGKAGVLPVQARGVTSSGKESCQFRQGSVTSSGKGHPILEKQLKTKNTHTKNSEKSVCNFSDNFFGFPKDFEITDELREYATENGIDPKKLNSFLEDFKIWAQAKGAKYEDWNAAFKLRVNNAQKFGPQFLKEHDPWEALYEKS